MHDYSETFIDNKTQKRKKTTFKLKFAYVRFVLTIHRRNIFYTLHIIRTPRIIYKHITVRFRFALTSLQKYMNYYIGYNRIE